MNSRCTTWKYEVNIIYTILETQLSIFLGVTVYKYIHIYTYIYMLGTQCLLVNPGILG